MSDENLKAEDCKNIKITSQGCGDCVIISFNVSTFDPLPTPGLFMFIRNKPEAPSEVEIKFKPFGRDSIKTGLEKDRFLSYVKIGDASEGNISWNDNTLDALKNKGLEVPQLLIKAFEQASEFNKTHEEFHFTSVIEHPRDVIYVETTRPTMISLRSTVDGHSRIRLNRENKVDERAGTICEKGNVSFSNEKVPVFFQQAFSNLLELHSMLIQKGTKTQPTIAFSKRDDKTGLNELRK